MRALFLDTELKLVTDYPTPRPLAGEALIRVSVTGICNTDLELAKGYMQFRGIPGHEFVGVVERAPGAEEWEGRRVVGEINAACRDCPTCRANSPTHCPHRTTLGIAGRDGAFAEYLTLPTRNLLPVPDSLPDEVAVFTEPLAAACEILQQVHVRPADRAILLGDGKLGLLCAQVLALTGCDLTAVGHHQEKLDILAQRGIPTALEDEAVEPGADLVIETTGHPEGYTAARGLVRPRGTIVLKSTYHDSDTGGSTDLAQVLTMTVVDEVTMVGSRCGPFAPALRLLKQGLVNVTPLIHARYPLDKALTAFEHAARPGTLKVLVET
ncbi:MAG: alcohol dehydrogenase catalytic domain-containing protein [Chloroflexota bacterium]|nr:alcohol dehydrogenase catalytic domain-containing protein [Chloroflexota bacterium]